MIVLSQKLWRRCAAWQVVAERWPPACQSENQDDPLGQRGVISASTYYTAVRLNDLRMAVVEVGVTAL